MRAHSRRRTQTHRAAFQSAALADLTTRRLDCAKYLPRMRQQRSPCFGQRHTLADSIKQGNAQLLFKSANLLTDRRLSLRAGLLPHAKS